MSVSYNHDIWILGVRASREGVYQAAARVVISLQILPDLFQPYYVSVATSWWVGRVRMGTGHNGIHLGDSRGCRSSLIICYNKRESLDPRVRMMMVHAFTSNPLFGQAIPPFHESTRTLFMGGTILRQRWGLRDLDYYPRGRLDSPGL